MADFYYYDNKGRQYTFHTETTYCYYDNRGVKSSPLSSQELVTLIADGKVSLETKLETEDGKKGEASEFVTVQRQTEDGSKSHRSWFEWICTLVGFTRGKLFMVRKKIEENRQITHYENVEKTETTAEQKLNKMLQEFGFDNIHAKFNGEFTPLHLAAINACDDVAELLISKEVDLEAKDKKGQTALHCTLLYDAEEGHRNITRMLIDNGADVNVASNTGYTPVHLVSANGYKDMLELLIISGANVNAKEKNGGWTPLHLAEKNRHEGIAELLIANGADINASDNFGRTPLIYAKGKSDITPTRYATQIIRPTKFEILRNAISFETAVPVDSTDEEYNLLRLLHPGSQLLLQSLKEHNGKHYDAMEMVTAENESITYYFDISSFYGKLPPEMEELIGKYSSEGNVINEQN